MNSHDMATAARLEELTRLLAERDAAIEERDAAISARDSAIEERDAMIDRLQEALRLFSDKVYGAKSEKARFIDVNQQELQFDEIECRADGESPEDEPGGEPTVVREHTRRGGGRKPLPDDLPRIEVIHDLDEADKVCACGHVLKRIGEEVTEQLEIIPAKAQVIRTIRCKYACTHCEGLEGPAITLAPLPETLLPKTLATPGLLAHIITAKFVDGLPLYRQAKGLQRLGIDLSDGKMSRWLMDVHGKCVPFQRLLEQSLLESELIGIDETPLQVLKEPGRGNTTKSFMWVFRGQNRGSPVLVYKYAPTRSGTVAGEVLTDYRGIIQTDGYAGYNALAGRPDIVHAGCWAHARRKFVEVVKGLSNKKHKKGSLAEQAIGAIGKLYDIERTLRDMPVDTRTLVRRQQSLPLLEEFHAWLKTNHSRVPPREKLGLAFAYALNQWDSLVRYASDGRIPIDNNLTENAIRPFVIGRKNWLFSGSPRGAWASAFFYSLVETAKACGLEPYAYLRLLFEHLPQAHTEQDLKALLPASLSRRTLQA